MKNNFKAHLLQLKAYPDNILGYTLFLCSNYLAIFGGLVLLSIVLINFSSIIGRILFSNPLVGDFELVEMGCAVAIFCFLPLCHLRRGNVTVDFFTMYCSKKYLNAFDTFASLLFAVVAGIFSWQMVLGGIDMFQYNEETMMLGLPVWIAFVPGVFSFLLLSLACFYTSVMGFEKERLK